MFSVFVAGGEAPKIDGQYQQTYSWSTATLWTKIGHK